MANRALRLTFAYDGDAVRLMDRQAVETVVPPDDSPGMDGQEEGFWIEIRDGRGQALYRRAMTDPLRRDVEVFSPDPEESIRRVPVPPRSGVFAVLLPDLDDAKDLVLMSSGAPTAEARGISPDEAAREPTGPAMELARFPAQGSVSDGGRGEEDGAGHG